MLSLFSRDEATRTPDPYVPNVVRYQLRYIPFANQLYRTMVIFLFASAKVQHFFETHAFLLGKICKYKKKHLPLHPQIRNNGAIAQLVEQRTENPCVPGSIPGGTTDIQKQVTDSQ